MSDTDKRRLVALDIIDRKLMEQQYVAIPKPRTDTIRTLEKYGAEIKLLNYIPIFDIKTRLLKSILWRVNKFYTLWSYFKKYGGVNNSIVVIQYPFTAALSESTKKTIFNNLHSKGNKLVLLFHDLESLRLPSIIKKDSEKYYLEIADACIFHSPQMAEKLYKMGMKFKNGVFLEFFDYLNDMQFQETGDLRNIKLIFAGNLVKSVFLQHLDKLPLKKDFEIYLYGAQIDNLKTSEHILYKGVFAPDDISVIEGNWGLVWDGNALDSCSGEYGNYLRINAPFKFSLYIAACRPVVVWKQSAMAQYVEKYNLGICVDSLFDIPSTVASLSDEQLNEISKGVIATSQIVRRGDKLGNVLNSIII